MDGDFVHRVGHRRRVGCRRQRERRVHRGIGAVTVVQKQVVQRRIRRHRRIHPVAVQAVRVGRPAVTGDPQDLQFIKVVNVAMHLPDNCPVVPDNGVVHEQYAVQVGVPSLDLVLEAHDVVSNGRRVGSLTARGTRAIHDEPDFGRAEVGEDTHFLVEGQVDLDGLAGPVDAVGRRRRSHGYAGNHRPDVHLVVA